MHCTEDEQVETWYHWQINYRVDKPKQEDYALSHKKGILKISPFVIIANLDFGKHYKLKHTWTFFNEKKKTTKKFSYSADNKLILICCKVTIQLIKLFTTLLMD